MRRVYLQLYPVGSINLNELKALAAGLILHVATGLLKMEKQSIYYVLSNAQDGDADLNVLERNREVVVSNRGLDPASAFVLEEVSASWRSTLAHGMGGDNVLDVLWEVSFNVRGIQR